MDWIEVSVTVDQEAAEAVAEQLRGIGQGVAIDVPFVQASPYDEAEPDAARQAIVKTYLPDDASAPDACRQAEEALWHLGRLRTVGPVTTRKIAEDDWANAWKSFFSVVHVGERTVVVPAWRRYRRRPGEVVVRLDPGLAFGTGTHPTTQLCLRALETLLSPWPGSGDKPPRAQGPVRVLDVGTGSGILSIAAAQLGAESVLGLDIDPLAVNAAHANVRLNRLSRRIEVREGSVDDQPGLATEGRFDVIACNVTARVNIRLAKPLAHLLAPAGRLVASGVLAQDFEAVAAAFQSAGLAVHERYDDEDWTAAVLGR